MKLIKFDMTNSSSKRINKCFIRFIANGVISISRGFVEIAELKAGDKISVAQDEDDPQAWFLIFGDINGFPCREQKGGVVEFSSSFTVKQLMESFSINAKSVSFDLASQKIENDDGLEMYAILTATAQYKEISE